MGLVGGVAVATGSETDPSGTTDAAAGPRSEASGVPDGIRPATHAPAQTSVIAATTAGGRDVARFMPPILPFAVGLRER
jgi:hypothetical protein